MCYDKRLFPGYRSGDYQSRYGYNSASSSQNGPNRGPWVSGFGPPPPFEYQHRNHYNNPHHQQSSWNNYQSTQQGYQSQGVCMSLVFIASRNMYAVESRKARFDPRFSIFLFYIF